MTQEQTQKPKPTGDEQVRVGTGRGGTGEMPGA